MTPDKDAVKETAKKLGGTFGHVTVEYNRKVSDNNYGSLGASVAIEFQLAAGEDPDKACDALYAWAEAAVSRNLKSTYDALPERSDVEIHERKESPSVAPPPPPPAQPALEPAPGENLPEFVTLERPTIAHVVSESGTHYCKVYGGMWTKYGVRAWPEVLSAASIIGWDTWPVGQQFQLPEGLSKALVQVEEEGEKVKPIKVMAFR